LGAGARAGASDVIAALAELNIEARPVWKPLHLQPLFHGAKVLGGGVADEIFRAGVCLPSGSGLTDAEQERIIACLTRLLM
jgi:pyridoxal phosphate-dependent aminotransferase EpsN